MLLVFFTHLGRKTDDYWVSPAPKSATSNKKTRRMEDKEEREAPLLVGVSVLRPLIRSVRARSLACFLAYLAVASAAPPKLARSMLSIRVQQASNGNAMGVHASSPVA